ncbi:hypothetical protein AV530_019133 [Patagioenas fasciata monilis]|uniref:Uncharacterized protein n=1 Tax=Patagioenas fasciata monilis TaxID=372326 RepID=A0A1V4KXA2_PATFA|nr:hypothetical protein AV530_019133 [Patagioenas fasciata monilis]
MLLELRNPHIHLYLLYNPVAICPSAVVWSRSALEQRKAAQAGPGSAGAERPNGPGRPRAAPRLEGIETNGLQFCVRIIAGA